MSLELSVPGSESSSVLDAPLETPYSSRPEDTGRPETLSSTMISQASEAGVCRDLTPHLFMWGILICTCIPVMEQPSQENLHTFYIIAPTLTSKSMVISKHHLPEHEI